ncbi:hypothetical protein R6Q59_025703 [Mikania micrantha]
MVGEKDTYEMEMMHEVETQTVYFVKKSTSKSEPTNQPLNHSDIGRSLNENWECWTTEGELCALRRIITSTATTVPPPSRRHRRSTIVARTTDSRTIVER